MVDIVIPLDCKVGIKRDNTDYNSEYYIEGEWCRFYDNSPKKMGGYKFIYAGTTEQIRTLYELNTSSTVNVYLGRETAGISFIDVSSNGTVLQAEVNRTPAGYVPVSGNIWSFDQITTLVSSVPFSIIFAQVSPIDINGNNTIEGGVYYGGANDTDLFVQAVNDNTPTPDPIVASGGIIVSTPFVIAYGNYGFIQWSDPLDPTVFPVAHKAIIANTPKIIGAATIRDNTNISVLFWCVDKLVRSTYDASLETFSSSI